MSAAKLSLKVIAPDKMIFASSEVDCISIPTPQGIISIYPEHAELLSLISVGEIQVEVGDKTITLAISSGVLKVLPGNTVEILADTGELAEEIDLARAEAARLRAEQLLANNHQSQTFSEVEIAKVQASIEKNITRLHVGNKLRKTHLPSLPTND
ncbi:MAG: ATP synthase F1 subunit epsilon [Candidatus Doudnabacteria bacterium]|nr:ATP synthase F1 subunit epsilon [Candidatus Doudnabacteria bacterium]